MLTAGKLKVLAVTGKDRSAVLPVVPTLAESGFPGFDMVSWQALVAPVATPRPVIDRLHAEVARVLKTAEMKEKMFGLGTEVVANTPEQFAQYIREETAKWSRIVRDAGIRLEN